MEKKGTDNFSASNQIVSAANAAIDSEFAKQEEELRRLDMELEESSKLQGLTNSLIDKDQLVDPEQIDGGQQTGTNVPGDDPDDRSVFVKNVDFSADEPQLTEHFKECGEIVRVTIRKNPHTQQSLGIAYIEFANKESAIKAKHLNESLFKGRQLTVMPKRKNKPGMSRGVGFGGRGASNPMAMMMTLMRGMTRGMYRGGPRGGRGAAPGGYRGRGGRGGAGGAQDQSTAGQQPPADK